MRVLLTVFARFPEPGKVKTRLAEGIGESAACSFYRACAERTFRRASKWAESSGRNLHIYTTNPQDQRWQKWLGGGWALHPQCSGDIGVRMREALEQGLSDGYDAVLCIGTDAPGLTQKHLEEACVALRNADTVIGPSRDGGYYLIGLKRPVPELFEDMPWSTSDVLKETQQKARAAGVDLRLISALNDVDTASDLRGGAGKVSAIIPTLNEEDQIATLLASVKNLGVNEIIVADGGSDDATVERATRSSAKVVESVPGRGPQLNAGAQAAEGSTLWFIHADTEPHPLALWELGQALRRPEIVGGAFEIHLHPLTPFLKILEWAINCRTRHTSSPYGDQAIFVRRSVFEHIGGFPDWPLMEDVELVRRMRRVG
ncbi:MAG: TIGR04282 family arsenosugar biosynthesis glycosyltransferase, partial [Planctomycetes bacterium]|nr:TIGR04282 family arsenosugar biosynthesis glycosyltransferase [Planctomycetota bacterium]